MGGARAAVVLDLGAGGIASVPRPFASNARYVAVDLDHAVMRARAGPAVIADGRALPLPAGSVDHVVARNVFGDVGLGHSFEQVTGFDPPGYAAHVADLLARGRRAELEVLRLRVRKMTETVDRTRFGILVETARVLRRGGNLLVVETMTPDFAAAYIERLRGGPNKDKAVLTIAGREWSCLCVRSHNRRRRYCVDDELAEPALQVWVLTPLG